MLKGARALAALGPLGVHLVALTLPELAGRGVLELTMSTRQSFGPATPAKARRSGPSLGRPSRESLGLLEGAQPASPASSEATTAAPRRIWVASVATAVRTVPNAMSFKIATLAEGQEVVEVWSRQHYHGWVQVEPRGFVQYDHLRPAEAAPLVVPHPRCSVGGLTAPAEATELEELRRAAEAEREDLRRVRAELRSARAELQDCREQRDELGRATSQMRSKLEACGEAVKRVVGALDAVYGERAGGEAEAAEAGLEETVLHTPLLGGSAEEAAREAGRDAIRLLAELGRGEDCEESRTDGADDENALRLSPTPSASHKVFDGQLLDTAPLGERIPLRAIN
ncbi:unnamed protein product [Prorocentrum cordatum]|uniref:SH3 domain-containing protein n=1 Tax=Prorocentrum cordatum TaxID=2364126 RepID=A0ABN9S3S2_9DINO|nr:unnamed protein product [Polarella glacialis]